MMKTWHAAMLTVAAVSLLETGPALAAPSARTVAARGAVTSVNGSTAPGTCGAVGAVGSFTLIDKHKAATTVGVQSTTTFIDTTDPSPSFADICVGTFIRTFGTPAADHSITAATVAVVSATVNTKGTVGSVNGSTTVGTCGVAGFSGSFTLTDNGTPVIVDVSSTTTFSDAVDPSPSFADICVGILAHASGTLTSDGSLNATTVSIASTGTVSAKGTVASVNGSTTAGTCGVAGFSGSFTLADNGTPVIVDVTSATTFSDAVDPSPSFADICVGTLAHASGTLADDGSITAATVVVSAGSVKVKGMVTSVNGSTTPGTCGNAGFSGTFTLTDKGTSVIVDVSSTTTFVDAADPSPSFADICIAALARASGTLANDGSLAALAVTAHP